MKVIIADFKTDNIELVEKKANTDEAIDKEVGRLLFHKDGGQAQYFIAEELSDNQGAVELLAKAFQIVFLDMQNEGLINNLNVFTEDIPPEDFKKYNT